MYKGQWYKKHTQRCDYDYLWLPMITFDVSVFTAYFSNSLMTLMYQNKKRYVLTCLWCCNQIMTLMISVRPVPMSGKDKEHHTQVPGRNVPSTVGRGLFIKLMRWHGFLISGVEATCEKPQSNFHLIYIRIIISNFFGKYTPKVCWVNMFWGYSQETWKLDIFQLSNRCWWDISTHGNTKYVVMAICSLVQKRSYVFKVKWEYNRGQMFLK